MRKRILIIVASIIVLAGIATGAYVLLAGKSAGLTVGSNPFGGTGSGDISAEGMPDVPAGAGEEVAPRLIRITERPVAEGVVVIDRTSTTTAPAADASSTPTVTSTTDAEIRFIDRASGNIYTFTDHARSLTRISNKTLPGIQKASWLPDGSKAYAQFLGDGDQVSTYVLPDSGEGGFFLEQNLAEAKVTDGGGVFTLLSGSTGSVGSISKSDGTGAHTVFTSLLSSLIVHPAHGVYFAHTKASAFLAGYGFEISANGSFTRLLGPLSGLSTLPSPDGKLLLYSYLDRGTVRLAVLDVTKHTATALPVSTLSEKCVWANDSLSVYCGIPTSLPPGLPDTWYQGAAPLSDRLWRIDILNRLATLVIDPNEVANTSIDAVALALDPAQDVLVFTDKATGALWVYDL